MLPAKMATESINIENNTFIDHQGYQRSAYVYHPKAYRLKGTYKVHWALKLSGCRDQPANFLHDGAAGNGLAEDSICLRQRSASAEGIARQNQNRELRTHLFQVWNQIPAIRQIEISENEIESLKLIELSQGFTGGLSGNHREAGLGQRNLQDLPNICVVLNNENGMGHGAPHSLTAKSLPE
jgi:hypothetical protein